MVLYQVRLMAIQWLRCGHHVHIVSTSIGIRSVCRMLYHLPPTLNTQLTSCVTLSHLHFRQYYLNGSKDVQKARKDLSQEARDGSLYVIADEAVQGYRGEIFKTFCNEIFAQVPRLHLWAASFFHRAAPANWQVEYLTRPLRSPPAVVREVERDLRITEVCDVLSYSQRGEPDHTDGPPVTRLYHRGQGHSGDLPGDCVTCGRQVASFLHSLRVGVTDNVNTSTISTSTIRRTSPCLQWRDVFVLYCDVDSDNPGMLTGLREASIPARVMTYEDIDDVATACSDVVWMTDGRRVRGLERKVVVCLFNVFARLHLISRCTSQLVIVSLPHMPHDHHSHFHTSHSW